MKFQLISAALLAGALVAAPAGAHPKLTAASPAENATVVRPARIQLRFSESLMPKLSGGTLVMTAMPGMSGHQPMAINGVKSSIGADGKTLVLIPTSPLGAGTYQIEWHAVSRDTHRVSGKYSFTVR